MQQIRKGYPLVPLENYQWQDFAINDKPQKSRMPKALKQTKAMMQVLAELPGSAMLVKIKRKTQNIS